MAIRFQSLLAVALFAQVAHLGAAQAQALANTVTVMGDWIALGDVANVAEADRGLPLMPAPQPGQRLALAPEFIAAKAHAAGIGAISLPEGMIWVVRAPGSATSSAPSATPARVSPNTAEPSEDVPPQVLSLARVVQKGELLTDADLVWIDAPSGRLPNGAVTEFEDAIGMEAKRTLRPGQPLRANDLQAERLVRKGEPVLVIYQSGTIRLTAQARALGDAALGQPVRVLNISTNRTLSVVASGPGRADITPPA
jgi:flagella basal body P-ring formation protein FlgA